MRESVAQAKGYTTLPYHVRGRAFHGHLFARPHVSRGDDIELPAKRTLFLLNVPLHLTADDVAAAFTRKDEEPIVRLGGIGTTLSTVGTCTAHVVFAQPAGLRRALAASKPLEFPAAEAAADNDPGVPSRAELQQNVGAFMEQFEAAEKKRQAEEDARHNQMDSDGCATAPLDRHDAMYCPLSQLCVLPPPQVRSGHAEALWPEHQHRGGHGCHSGCGLRRRC